MTDEKNGKTSGGVPNESDGVRFGLTKNELRARLKHIAGLCYALSCDISNVEIEAEVLRAENEYLIDRLKRAGVNVYREGEDPSKKRLATMKYWEKKRKEAGLSSDDSPELRKERKRRPKSPEAIAKQRETLKKTWAKRKAQSREASEASGDGCSAALRETSQTVGEAATSPRPLGSDQRGEAE